jgi:ABC-type transport system substrate-binding protein
VRAAAQPNRRRALWSLGVVLLVGVAALAAPRLPTRSAASSGAVKRGGTFRATSSARVFALDPSIVVDGWRAVLSMHLYLLTYSDKPGANESLLVPEAATGFPRVSADGKTYTFTIRRGFRFSDGSPVTAANFAYSFNRALNPVLNSSAAAFISDIVGARAVREGKATTARGIVVKGKYTLIVRLVAPAADFPARVALPNLPAIPLGLPIVDGGVTGAPLHSAGPYYVIENEPGHRVVFVRNRFWRPELAPHRLDNVDRAVITLGLDPEESVAGVERGEYDSTGVPVSERRRLVRQFGVNKRRLFVVPMNTVWYLAFNPRSPLFGGNPKLRRAVGFALDRPALARAYGYLELRRADQLLPPGSPGYRDAHIYPLNAPDLDRARALARGNTRNGRAVLYTANTVDREIAGVLKYDLAQIGITADVKAFEFPALDARLADPNEPWDVTELAWYADYADPYDYICVPGGACALQGQTHSFFSAVPWVRRIEATQRLTGDARYAAFAKLDADLVRDAAPVVPYGVGNNVVFYSEHVGCVTFGPPVAISRVPRYGTYCMR